MDWITDSIENWGPETSRLAGESNSAAEYLAKIVKFLNSFGPAEIGYENLGDAVQREINPQLQEGPFVPELGMLGGYKGQTLDIKNKLAAGTMGLLGDPKIKKLAFAIQRNNWGPRKLIKAVIDMAGGGEGDGMRQEYFSDWSGDDFKKLVNLLDVLHREGSKLLKWSGYLPSDDIKDMEYFKEKTRGPMNLPVKSRQ
jgi:hypothetical protein